jgi:uncharacterized membrane protein
MSKPLLALVCCVSAFAYAAPAASSAFYEVLTRWAEPHVSADGSAVVASVAFPDFVGTVYRWTLSDSGLTTETLPLDHAQVHGTNRDGSVIVGTTVGGAFRWTAKGGTQILGAPSGAALDVSSDGTVVVGVSSWADGEAFYWTEALGFLPLGFLQGDSRSQAMAVAGNGGPVVGLSIGPPNIPPRPSFPPEPPSLRAFRWTPARGMHGLGTLPDRTGSGQARGISSDGDVIVGQFDFEAFRWTAADGMVGLGSLPGGPPYSEAHDVSSDGNRIVGSTASADRNQVAFLWTPDDGMRSLEEILIVDEGLDLAGVELLTANSISDDGQVIAGSGHRPRGPQVTWIADLTEVSRPDTPTELPNARGPWQFFSITRDARRCVSPVCGGWWVQAVNEALTRCADGSWAQACYVADLDTSRVSGDLTEFNNSHNNLAFGRVKRQKYPGFGNLGELVVTDAWYGAAPHGFSTGFGPEWSAVWDNGIRCTSFPCNSTGQEFLNTGATGNVSILDLSAVAVDPAERDLALWLRANDLLLVAGRNVLFINRGPADDGVALIANQIYLPLAGGGANLVDD